MNNQGSENKTTDTELTQVKSHVCWENMFSHEQLKVR